MASFFSSQRTHAKLDDAPLGVGSQCRDRVWYTANCWIGDDSSRIYHSPDLGITWTYQNGQNVPAPALYAIHFFNDSTGCAVGAAGYITATTNGGEVWTTTTGASPHALRGVFVASSTKAWAVGDAGTIITTSNAFNSWTPQSSPTNVALRSVSFSDTLNGYILGDSGTVLKTTDGGTTWSLAQSPASALNAMKFISSSEGWVVGDSGKIFTTNTGGTQWARQLSGVTAKLLSVDFLDAQNGITIGNGGIILTTKNGGLMGRRYFADRCRRPLRSNRITRTRSTRQQQSPSQFHHARLYP